MVAPVVDISVAGRFHAFDLARELDSRGMLGTLHTGYPAPFVPRFGVPKNRVRSTWGTIPLYKMFRQLESLGLAGRQADYIVSERHDRIVARRLRPGPSVFVGWSSQSLRSIAASQALGMVAILERGSAHIEWQQETLTREAELTGLPVELPHQRSVEQELAEYAAADFICVPSAFSARTFAERGVSSAKVFVNPYGVDLSRFSPNAVPASVPVFDGARLKVVHVGRVSAQKGAHYLADAAAKVSGAKLVFVGPVERGLERYLERPYVEMVGAVPGAAVPGFLRAADVFALLSVQEGLALVIAQAMAAGLPIIATPNTGAEELITDGVEGFLVPARNPVAAAERMEHLASDTSLRMEMGRRARARVAALGWHEYGQRAAAFYARVAV